MLINESLVTVEPTIEPVTLDEVKVRARVDLDDAQDDDLLTALAISARKLCEEYLEGRYDLEVVDIYQHPLSASENQIFASPTLIKKLPPPIRKFVGDMTKKDKILAGLGLLIDDKKE